MWNSDENTCAILVHNRRKMAMEAKVLFSLIGQDIFTLHTMMDRQRKGRTGERKNRKNEQSHGPVYQVQCWETEEKLMETRTGDRTNRRTDRQTCRHKTKTQTNKHCAAYPNV